MLHTESDCIVEKKKDETVSILFRKCGVQITESDFWSFWLSSFLYQLSFDICWEICDIFTYNSTVFFHKHMDMKKPIGQLFDEIL